jgi:prepilin-type N-terminal cleavage/methylation domain-containing protein/prepilin-type processing-associated H-X9-DG protein
MRHRAFTLVELLVVIAVLAILVSLSSPVLVACRARAKTLKCQTNIRQLLMSLQAYDAANQTLPYGFDFRGGARPPGGYIGNASFEMQGWWWFHYTGLVRNRSWKEFDVLRCPSTRLGDLKLELDLLCGAYGVNRSLCKTSLSLCRSFYTGEFAGAPVSTGVLRHPGATLLVVDSGYSLISWWNATADPPAPLGDKFIEDTAYIPGLEINKGRFLWPGQTLDAVGGRHANRTVNVGFADGHADFRPAGELLVERTKDKHYTNMALWKGQ